MTCPEGSANGGSCSGSANTMCCIPAAVTQSSGSGGAPWPPNPYTYQNPLGTVKVGDLIARVIGQILPIVGAIFWAMMMYGGFLWLTAGDDSKRTTKARGVIVNGAIGMAIVIGAYVIATTVIATIGKGLGQ